MRIFQGLILAAFVTAALAGCEPNQTVTPENDTSKKIQTGNNPSPTARPGGAPMPAGVTPKGGGGSAPGASGGAAPGGAK